MSPRATYSNDDLWDRVSRIVDTLRNAGSGTDADLLQRAITISAHPGEVWPETLAVLRVLLERRPRGLDEEAARACAGYLARWP